MNKTTETFTLSGGGNVVQKLKILSENMKKIQN